MLCGECPYVAMLNVIIMIVIILSIVMLDVVVVSVVMLYVILLSVVVPLSHTPQQKLRRRLLNSVKCRLSECRGANNVFLLF